MYYFVVLINCNKYEPIILKVSIDIKDIISFIKEFDVEVVSYKNYKEFEDKIKSAKSETYEYLELEDNSILTSEYYIDKETFNKIMLYAESNIEQKMCNPVICIYENQNGNIPSIMREAWERNI